MKRLKQSIFVKIILVLALALVVYLGFDLRTRYFLKQNHAEKRPAAINTFSYRESRAPEGFQELAANDNQEIYPRHTVKNKNFETIKEQYPAGQKPDAAWHTLIRSWENKVRDPGLGVYTEITKLAYRDFQNLPDARYENDVRVYKNKSYEILQNSDYAVIYFGKHKGWQHVPYLFCRTDAGWQFDIVHQRKYVRMGPKPHWGIEKANYPYVDLLTRCPFWMNQDIPLEENDIYRVEDDLHLAGRIRQLEQAYAGQPDDFETVMELGRLYTITSLRSRKRIAILTKAQELNPQSSMPYKYLAISQLDGFINIKAATAAMETYVAREPWDVFGHNYLGYLYLCKERHRDAIVEFEKALELSPDNIYAHAKISRAYAGLFLRSSKTGSEAINYKNKAIEMYASADAYATHDSRRLRWLAAYLKKKGLLDTASRP